MSTLILPNGLNNAKANPATMVEDDRGQKPPPSIHPLFKAILQAVLQGDANLKRKGVYVDLGLKKETQDIQRDLGVFKTQVDKWTVTLNWTTRRQGSIPAHYASVEYADMPVGIISPYLTERECWKCGTLDLEAGRPCPNCHQLDWWGRLVHPRDCHQALAVFIADRTGRAHLWEAFDGKKTEAEMAESRGGSESN